MVFGARHPSGNSVPAMHAMSEDDRAGSGNSIGGLVPSWPPVMALKTSPWLGPVPVHGRRDVCGGDVTRRQELEMADQDSIQTGCGCLMMAIAFLIVSAAFRACVGGV